MQCRSTVEIGCTVEIGRGLSQPESDAFNEHVKTLLQVLLTVLPRKLRDGLGVIKSITEKRKWKELGEVRL
jgi:hypothetical protein